MKRYLRLFLALAFTISIGLTSGGYAYAQDPPTVSEFAAPLRPNGNGVGPYGLTTGPDGNIWTVEWDGNAVGRVTPSGVTTQFPLPDGYGNPFQIKAGSDGNLWFTQYQGNSIGRITPSGDITEFAIPTGGSDPTGLALGSDGNIWFTEEVANQIGKITPSGVITEYSVPTANSQPFTITNGPDGNLWFTEENANTIGVITPSGSIGEYIITNAGGNVGPYGSEPISITAGSDGNIWFTEYYGSYIGSINLTTGVMTHYLLPSSVVNPNRITSGPDGNLWFTANRNSIGQLNPLTGSLSTVDIPTRGSGSVDITSGPDGNVWFAEYGNNSLARINLASSITAPSITSANSYNAVAGDSLNFTVSTAGSPTSAITETGALPSGVTFADNSDGTASLAGTPQAGSAGTYPITITASNGPSSSVTQNFTLTVTPAAPIFTSSASYSVGMRQSISASSLTVTATGAPTATLTESGALPTGLTFVDNGDGTANFTGQAAAGTNGVYPVTLTATNGSTSPTTQNFTLTVTTATSAPAITSNNSDTVSFGQPYSFTFTTSGYPAPTLKKSGTLPVGLTFVDNGDGTATLSGTPTGSANGLYTLNITAKSTVASTTQSFSLTVTKAPVFKSIPARNLIATVGSSYSTTVTATTYGPTIVIETGTLPNGISFVDNGNGTATLTGTPSTGAGGAYPLTLTATNSYGSATKNVTLSVDEAPTITSNAGATAVIGNPFSFNVTSSGYPKATYTLTGTLPTGIRFNTTTGVFSGTPRATNVAGTYPLTITAANSLGTSATQEFDLVLL
jgi:streptogramin lyase